MAACRPLSYDGGFLGGVLDFIDCQAQNIGSQGYQALAAPGSVLSLLLTGFLTLFVALFGYRMLFGHAPGVRDGVLALAKIGVVLALATSWPAYRALVYDVALHGPAELASGIGGPAGVPGARGGLVPRLQIADAALVALAREGIGPVETRQRVTVPRQINGRTEMVVEAGREPDNTFDPWALNGARAIFLIGAIGALAAVRLIAGLLLALGPFFIAFLLFEGTRGLFEGWVRGLAGAALGALGVTLVLGVELALIEPWLAGLLARRAANLSIVGAPVELLVVMSLFALALVAMLGASARIAMGFRLPPSWRSAPAQFAASLRGGALAQPRLAVAGPQVPAAERSRAAAVAEAVAAAQRRETRLSGGYGPSVAAGAGRSAAGLARDLPPPAPVPLGQSNARRTRSRATASGSRRDLRP